MRKSAVSMTDQPTLPHPGGRPSKYQPDYCEQVELCMAAGYSLTAFAGFIGVNKDTLNEWMRVHPEFSDAVMRAKARRLVLGETLMLRGMVHGAPQGASTLII